MEIKQRNHGDSKIYRISGEIPGCKPELRYVSMTFPDAKLMQHKPELAHMYEHMMLNYGRRNGMNDHLILSDCYVQSSGIVVSYWVRSTIKESEEFVLNMVFNPVFDLDELKSEKDVIKNELYDDLYSEEECFDIPRYMEYLMGLPKGLNDVGKISDIDNITIEDLLILKEKMRSSFYFIAFEYGPSDESTIDYNTPCGISCKADINPPISPIKLTIKKSYNDKCEVLLSWRRDGIRNMKEGFIEFYVMNSIFHYINTDNNISFSVLSKLRKKGICYSLDSEDLSFFGNFADCIHIASIGCDDYMKIKDELFLCLDDITKRGIDKNEFDYAIDKYKTEIMDGSFEGYLDHICFCIKNNIPNDMEVLRFINKLSNEELMDMFVDHISNYYKEKDVCILASSGESNISDHSDIG